MVNINRETAPIQLLSKSTISVNNLKLTIDEQDNISIQTGGEWSGNLTELFELISVIKGDFNANQLEAERR